MRVLLLHAHPVAESFNGHLHRVMHAQLLRAGHDVDDCDLYAENFDPRLTRAERLGYHDEQTNIEPVRDYVDRLRAADALVLSYPVWNFGYPAILKGFFDRVFLPGVSFKLVNGKVRPCLHNIKKVSVATTYGGSRMRAFLVGDPPRKAVNRVLRVIVKPGAPFDYLAHYDINRSTDETRAAFIAQVTTAMGRF